jgi:hypothetical protein
MSSAPIAVRLPAIRRWATAPSLRGRSGSGPEPVEDAVDLRCGEDLAGGGAAQVGPGAQAVGALALPAHPQRPARGRRGAGAGGVAAVQPQVHVQGVGAEAGEQVLAVGGHLVEHPVVEQRRARGEAALGTGDVHGSSGEGQRLVPGQPVQRVALRHGRLGTSCPQLHR